MQRSAIYICFMGIFMTSAQARPVSYPDAWTLMIKNDAYQNSLHAHYTTDMHHSLGLRLRYDRELDATFVGVQGNRLFKRWNKPDSQANFYGRVAVGSVIDDNDASERRPRIGDDMGLFLGLSADWETRRYFVEGAAEYWDQGRFGDYATYHGRLGIAPYIAGTGALHTWIMVEGHNRPQAGDPLAATLLLRFFKGPSLLEVGVDDQGEPMLNYIHRF